MLKKIALAAAMTAVMSATTFAADKASEAASFIGVVNVPLIMNDIPQAKASKEVLQKEFAPRNAELQKMETEGKALQQSLPTLKGEQATEAQRKLAQMQADFNLKVRALQEDQQKRVHEEEVKLGRMVQEAIDAIAKERGLQLVVRGEAVAFATKAVDISEEVIKRVGKQGDSNKKAAKK